MNQQTFDKAMQAVHEADYAQKILDEMRFRGVTDHVALTVVKLALKRADQRYAALRER